MQISRYLLKRKVVFGVLLTVVVWLATSIAFAQSSTNQSQNPHSSNATDANSGANAGASTNGALIQELEQMRKRIDQLEGQVKALSQAQSPQAVSQETGAGQELFVSSTTAQPASATAYKPEQTNAEKQKPAEPFAFADWTWLNGNARTKEPAFDSRLFTPEIRFDAAYVYDFNHPSDDTIGGSAEVFRAQEFQLTQLGVGGDFHYDNVRGRLMTQFGMYSQTQPRNDASPARGQWTLDGAYRYLAEAYGGYHFNEMHGIDLLPKIRTS